MSDIIDNNISEASERKQAEQAARAKFCEANETTCRIIEEYITGGYVNTLAKLLVYVGTERAKNILSKMAEADRQRIETAYKALADKKVTDPDVISEAGKVLKNAGFYGNNAAKDGKYQICIEVCGNEVKQELTNYNDRPTKEQYDVLDKWHEKHGLVNS